MKKSWGLIPKILSGEKTIESRWYQTRRAPWDRVSVGDIIFFKNSGEAVTDRALVTEVLQFELQNKLDVVKIIKRYRKEICLVNSNPATWSKLLNYCILLRLQNPEILTRPFQINKRGFGTGAAWITIDNVNKIKK